MQFYNEHTFPTNTPQMWVTFEDSADVDFSNEILVQFKGASSTTGDVSLTTQGGATGYNNSTVNTVAEANRWNHYAMQKTANSTDIYFYVNGTLVVTLTGTSQLTCIDKVSIQSFFADADHKNMIREVMMWSEARYPTTSPSGGTVGWTIPDGRRRWNSMML